MKFRLVYEGKLRSSQPADNPPTTNRGIELTQHKHEIRKQIHSQLHNLWASHPVLSGIKICTSCGKNHALDVFKDIEPPHIEKPLANYIQEHDDTIKANKRHKNAHHIFCPLVSTALGLQCSIDILLLREDAVAGVYKSGDLDNRIKTLIDGLTTPRTSDQIPANSMPSTDETPFYTLLADDNIISSLKVETDTRHKKEGDNSFVTAIITVDVKPINPNFINLSFV
jgi:hypothetical protein